MVYFKIFLIYLIRYIFSILSRPYLIQESFKINNKRVCLEFSFESIRTEEERLKMQHVKPSETVYRHRGNQKVLKDEIRRPYCPLYWNKSVISLLHPFFPFLLPFLSLGFFPSLLSSLLSSLFLSSFLYGKGVFETVR